MTSHGSEPGQHVRRGPPQSLDALGLLEQAVAET
jgi:hypothetical protein